MGPLFASLNRACRRKAGQQIRSRPRLTFVPVDSFGLWSFAVRWSPVGDRRSSDEVRGSLDCGRRSAFAARRSVLGLQCTTVWDLGCLACRWSLLPFSSSPPYVGWCGLRRTDRSVCHSDGPSPQFRSCEGRCRPCLPRRDLADAAWRAGWRMAGGDALSIRQQDRYRDNRVSAAAAPESELCPDEICWRIR